MGSFGSFSVSVVFSLSVSFTADSGSNAEDAGSVSGVVFFMSLLPAQAVSERASRNAHPVDILFLENNDIHNLHCMIDLCFVFQEHF